MGYIFKVLLVLHIIGGSIGLIAGTISIVRKKGDKLHGSIGKLFLTGMLATGFSSLVLAIIHPNYFLFIVGIFTIYMSATGQRYLRLKRLQECQKILAIDYVLTYGMLVAALAFIGFGIYLVIKSQQFGAVFLVFGVLSLRMVRKDIHNYRCKDGEKNYWLIAHLQRMMGAYAASATAFVVVNNTGILPGVITWLLPTAIILPLIVKWTKKYKVPLSAKL
ncbi:MAG: DUF2306 domain-containing protein [Filimonas sp.]|nr:DUF2306 domain-containing protein [Filimonas sp.]